MAIIESNRAGGTSMTNENITENELAELIGKMVLKIAALQEMQNDL